MKTLGSFLNGCFGEARDLEEATRNGGVAGGVEGGRGLGLVRSDGGVWFERCGGADFHFKVVQGAFRFDDAVPAEGGTGFRKGSGRKPKFAEAMELTATRLPGSVIAALNDLAASKGVTRSEVILALLAKAHKPIRDAVDKISTAKK